MVNLMISGRSLPESPFEVAKKKNNSWRCNGQTDCEQSVSQEGAIIALVDGEALDVLGVAESNSIDDLDLVWPV